jgi:hypothetical protein
MSIGSARRRIGASPCGGSGRPSRLWLGPKVVDACLMTWRCLEAVGVFAALALGAIAVVKIVDALLDGIH